MTTPDTWRAKRIAQLTSELTALKTNIARDNSLNYIRMQFYHMYGPDRYDKDGWDTEIRSARISVYNNGQEYRPDTYYTLELETDDVIILYEYQRVEHYDETWRVYIRLPEDITTGKRSWIPIPKFEVIQDVGTDFERELIYTLLKYTPSPGFESIIPDYDAPLPEINWFKRALANNTAYENDDAEPQLGSLLD